MCKVYLTFSIKIRNTIRSQLRKYRNTMEITEETSTGIYRITGEGKVYSQSKLKIPLVGKGMEHTGKFKEILKPERELTYTLNNRGYYSIGIMKKTFMVHRLIAKAFIPNPKNKPFVNHIDGNKLNNSMNNLEWCTAQENTQHSFDAGLRSKVGLENSLKNLINKSKLTDTQVKYVRKVFIPRHKKFSATALAHKFGVSTAAMCKIVKGETYGHIT